MNKKNSGLHILEIELTNKCNLNCKHCYVNKDHPTELPYNKVIDLINQAKELGVYRLVFTGGEPLLYKELFNVAKYAKKVNIKELYLLTNGILVNKDNADKLKIFDGVQLSLDDTPTRQSLRKNYSDILERTVLLLQSKKIKINFYCTLCQSNYNEIDQIINYAKKLRVRIGFNTLIPLDSILEKQTLSPFQIKKSFQKIIMYINKGYNINLSHHLRFLVDKQKLIECETLINKDPNKIYGGCLAGIAALYICSDGTILACPFVKYPCDSIYINDLNNIWENNETLNLLRNRKLFEGKCGKCKYVNVCGGCRAQSLIKYGKINSSEYGCFYNL